MLTGALIRMLDKAESVRSVRAITWMLERATGFKSQDIVTFGLDRDSNWYRDNGYNRISSFLGSGSSWTGKSYCTLDASFDVSAFFCGTRLIAEDMGTLPFPTYRRSDDRTKIERHYAHPLYKTLHDLWNPEVAAGEGVEALTAHALVTGDGFARIQRFDSGTFLWPWQPQDVRIERNTAGVSFYLHRDGRGPEKTYTRDDVFHLRGFTTNGARGQSTAHRLRHVLGIASAAEEYAGRFFAQDAAPGLTITFPAGVGPMDPTSVLAFKEAWKKWHQGAAHSHEPAVLQNGATVSRISQSNADAQLIEVRKQQLEEICRGLRIPPHKLAHLDRSTNNNIEHQGIEYVRDTIGPWVRRWRQAAYRCLLTFDEQQAGNVWAEHIIESLQRADFATQAEGWRKMLEKGVYSINEVRGWQNLNPVPGGDVHLVQLNLSTVQAVAQGLNLPEPLPKVVQ